MPTFNFKCPMIYPMKCNLPQTEKIPLDKTTEEFSVFFILQFDRGDKYVRSVIEECFRKPRFKLIVADEDPALGIKICKICRLALASDFGIACLTPENWNVYFEVGLMIGQQKPMIYLYNSDEKKKEEVPFDLSDQVYIPYNNEDTLRRELDRHVTRFLGRVILYNQFQKEFRKHIKNKVASLSTDKKKALKYLLLENKRVLMEPFLLASPSLRNEIFSLELEHGLVETERETYISAKQTRTRIYAQIPPQYKETLEGLFEEGIL